MKLVRNTKVKLPRKDPIKKSLNSQAEDYYMDMSSENESSNLGDFFAKNGDEFD